MAYNINKTPAPTKPKAPDVVSEARLGGDGYGQNSGRSNPSAIPVGNQLMSPLAANLKASANDGGTLDHVISQGAKIPSPQTRNVSRTPYPVAVGCKDANANNPKVPGAVGVQMVNQSASRNNWTAERITTLDARNFETRIWDELSLALVVNRDVPEFWDDETIGQELRRIWNERKPWELF